MDEVTEGGGPPAPAGAVGGERVVGYDVARSLALLGMIVVHFTLVAAAGHSGPAWLTGVLGFLDGRAAVTFVVLAGIGLTLLSRRAVAEGDSRALHDVRKTLVRRGLFLLAIGFLNLLIWPGDILRVYGVSLLIAPWLLTASGRQLLLLSAGFAVAFAALVVVGDFERNWDWQTMTYRNLWTPTGVVRNLFYDGFRSVLPWTGFILFGMWLGRLDLREREVNRCVLLAAGGVAVGAEVVSRGLVSHFLAHPREDLDPETVKALFGTESMPALPLFLLAAGGTATVVIALCVGATTSWPGRTWRPLVATGQMALTWYFTHIVVGLGSLVVLGVVGTESLAAAAGYGMPFFGIAVILSSLWKAVCRHGPLEWVMRRVAG